VANAVSLSFLQPAADATIGNEKREQNEVNLSFPGVRERRYLSCLAGVILGSNVGESSALRVIRRWLHSFLAMV
jgi:hypothetical protein